MHALNVSLAVLALASSAYARAAVEPTLPSLPADDSVVVRQDARVLRTLPDRPSELHVGRPVDVAVGEVPDVRTAPPSDDKRYNTRTEKEWTWQSPQRGTNATGLWPMPSTSGQPGTLQ